MALLAVMLYVLLLRPTAVAKGFAREMKIAAQANFKSISEQYFGGMRPDEASLDADMRRRGWIDVLRCRQVFHIRMERPLGRENQWLISVHDFYATPIGVNDLGGPYLITRIGR
jgi:hypothetical protein